MITERPLSETAPFGNNVQKTPTLSELHSMLVMLNEKTEGVYARLERIDLVLRETLK